VIKKIARQVLPAGSKRRIAAGRVKQIILGTNRKVYRKWMRNIEPQTFVDASTLKQDILFSVVVPTYNTPERYLRPLIESFQAQTYPKWEVCLIDGSTDPAAAERIRAAAATDSRFTYVPLGKNLGISGNTNEGLRHVSGDFIGFVDHDDTLAPGALAEMRHAVALTPDVGLIYSDEDKLNDRGTSRTIPFFKPDWSPELLLNVNYITHFVMVRRELLKKVKGLRPEYDGAQDYDFLLRIMDHQPRVVHIPRILYHWRLAQGSTAKTVGEKSYANTAGQRALADYLARNKIDADVIELKERPTNYRIRYKTPGNPKVSIIIPFKDKVELLKVLLPSIERKTTYRNYEIILVSNNSTEKRTHDYLATLAGNKRIKVLYYDHPFNYSAVNNFGRSKATGSVLVFLNNDTKVLNKEWLEELTSVALRPEVGAVGAMLFYPDNTIQHAGVVVGLTGMAGHVFRNLKPGTWTPFGLPDWPRDYLSVTGACLAVEAAKFDAVKGFNEDFIICGSDVTLCLDLHKQGHRNVYWPYAKLMHYESKSVVSYKNAPIGDYELSLVKYQPFLSEGDPYYNVNLDLIHETPLLKKVL